MSTGHLNLVVEVTDQHQYVVSRLQASKGRWPAIAEATKIPRNTLAKVADGRIKNPGYKTVLAAARYFHLLEHGGDA